MKNSKTTSSASRRVSDLFYFFADVYGPHAPREVAVRFAWQSRKTARRFGLCWGDLGAALAEFVAGERFGFDLGIDNRARLALSAVAYRVREEWMA